MPSESGGREGFPRAVDLDGSGSECRVCGVYAGCCLDREVSAALFLSREEVDDPTISLVTQHRDFGLPPEFPSPDCGCRRKSEPETLQRREYTTPANAST